MIEIKVNDEIKDVEFQLFMGLTLREILWSLTSCIVSIITGGIMYFKLYINLTVTAYISMIIVTPFAAIGFLKWRNYTLLFAAKIILAKVLSPKYKLYENYEERGLKNAKIGFKHSGKKSC